MFEYDIAISFGITCKPAFHLKQNGFRIFANPMDWQVCSMCDQINLYKNRFETFYSNYYEDINLRRHENFRAVIDSENNILSMHHIRTELSLEDGVEEFVSLMKKRFYRLEYFINQASSVLLVSDEKVTISNAKKVLKEFAKIFPNKKITLVNVVDSHGKYFKRYYKINKKLDIVRYFFNDKYVYNEYFPPEFFNWVGNINNWNKVLKNYKLNYDFYL